MQTLHHVSQVLFDKIFLSYFLKPLFVSSDESIRDWRFRWSVDRYVSEGQCCFATSNSFVHYAFVYFQEFYLWVGLFLVSHPYKEVC